MKVVFIDRNQTTVVPTTRRLLHDPHLLRQNSTEEQSLSWQTGGHKCEKSRLVCFIFNCGGGL